jgi:hypothetical protein
LTLQPIDAMDSIGSESAPKRAVLQCESVQLESFDSGRKELDDTPLVIRLRRPEQLLAREEHLVELMQGAVAQWNAREEPPTKRMRTE